MADTQKVYDAVRAHYGAFARDAAVESGCCGSGPSSAESCGCSPQLYDDVLLRDLPGDVAGLSLGCGDPITLASLNAGETVLDLGSGAGLDCFMAARQVGAGGRVIGVDMTPEMVAKARANAEKLNMDTRNVEFRLGQIEALPVEDASVDVIISNCVINLSPDKPAVFREAFRALKPGGRVAVSDIVTQGNLLPTVGSGLDAWAACIAGAIDVGEYVGHMREVGFVDIQVVDKVGAGTLLGVNIPTPRIFSARITARKPAVEEIATQEGDIVSGSKPYFDDVADQWDSMRQSFFSDEVRELALKRAGVRAGQLAADVGAGSGFITEGLVREGLRVIAVDQSEHMLDQIRQKFGDAVDIDCRRGDADALPIEDGVLDHAFANMYLHHVEHPAAAIREMARTLKPGGTLIITDLDEHDFEFLRIEHHDRWMGLAREDMQRWFEEAGLLNVEVGDVGSSCCTESACGCTSATVRIFIAAGIKPH